MNRDEDDEYMSDTHEEDDLPYEDDDQDVVAMPIHEEPDMKRRKLAPWTCGICTFENEPCHLVCGACMTERKVAAAAMTPAATHTVTNTVVHAAGATWTCLACTMVHETMRDTRCPICDTPRPAEQNKAAPAASPTQATTPMSETTPAASPIDPLAKALEEILFAMTPGILENSSCDAINSMSGAPGGVPSDAMDDDHTPSSEQVPVPGSMSEEEAAAFAAAQATQTAVVLTPPPSPVKQVKDDDAAPLSHLVPENVSNTTAEDSGDAFREQWFAPSNVTEDTLLMQDSYKEAACKAVSRVLAAFDATLVKSKLLVEDDMRAWRRCLVRLVTRRAISIQEALEEKQRKLGETDCAAGCGKKARDTTVQQIVGCEHVVCLSCLRDHTMRLVSDPESAIGCIGCPSTACSQSDIGTQAVQRCLSKREFDLFLDATFRATIQGKMMDGTKGGGAAGSLSFVQCPNEKCKQVVEMIPLDKNSAAWRRKSNEPITETDSEGKVLTREAFDHFQEHRMRCNACQTVWCTSCKVQPYHTGRDCAQHLAYGVAAHCRFCLEQLTAENIDTLAGERGIVCCTGEECKPRMERTCPTKLACGHMCYGTCEDTEHTHPPCLHEDCSKPEVKACGSDLCSICWTEGLETAPVIQLSTCGHVVHEHCVRSKIEKRWPGVRITWGYLDCSQCKQTMTADAFPNSKAIRDLFGPIDALYKDISSRAVARITVEGMDKDDKLTDPASPFYNKPVEYALASFAFYNCWKCKNHYFGGRRACAQNADAENQPKEDFVCFDCSDMKALVKCTNPAHADYALWRCRFCMSPAVWYCFGTHHFCDPCHQDTRKQMNRPEKDTPQCPCNGDVTKCPIKMPHPPCGPAATSELCIGCAACAESAMINEKRREQDAEVEKLIAAGDIVAAAAKAANKIEMPKAPENLPPLKRLSAHRAYDTDDEDAAMEDEEDDIEY